MTQILEAVVSQPPKAFLDLDVIGSRKHQMSFMTISIVISVDRSQTFDTFVIERKKCLVKYKTGTLLFLLDSVMLSF